MQLALQFWLLLLLVWAGKNGEAKKGKRKKSIATFKYEDSDTVSNFYLFNNKTANSGQRVVRDIMRAIHAQQHPPKHECKTRRLLAIHLRTSTLEGLGSITKQIIVGLAVAMHSDRTLVWGLAPPFLYDHTRDIWADDLKIKVGMNDIKCPKDKDPGGGPYECFFEKLSSCSLLDATREEMSELATNAFDDSSRIMVSDVSQTTRKSVTMYHPPKGLIDDILKVQSAQVHTKCHENALLTVITIMMMT